MIQRAALILLLLVFTGVVGLFAAGQFGIPLPWDMATTTEAPDPAQKDAASQDRDASPTDTDEPAKQTAETPEEVIDETVAALQGAAPEAKPEAGSVALDVSRIAPDSFSVFAGRAEPNSYVTVTENGKPAGTVRADANGEWSLVTDHKFASADPKLTFEASSTPPPEPEAASAPTTTAEAPSAAGQQDTAAASPSADAVAGDVMRKFENLVSEARETAARETEEKEKAEQARKAEEAEQERQSAQAVAEAKPDVPADGAAPDTPAATEPASEPDPSTRSEAASETADAAADSEDTEKVERADTDDADTDNAASGTRVAASEQRDDTPAAIPVPIMFVYNEATLTSEGKRAADLLLEYLTLKRLASVELTGHADERGSLEYNFDLSRERLETVSQLLKEGGYTGQLKLTPKGKTEPFMGVDRKKFRGEALHQLDRRVELRVTR